MILNCDSSKGIYRCSDESEKIRLIWFDLKICVGTRGIANSSISQRVKNSLVTYSPVLSVNEDVLNLVVERRGGTFAAPMNLP